MSAPGICERVGCGHAYASHAPFNDTQICNECARPWEGLGVGGEFHAFEGPRLAGGTFDPEAERAAYDKAMREKRSSTPCRWAAHPEAGGWECVTHGGWSRGSDLELSHACNNRYVRVLDPTTHIVERVEGNIAMKRDRHELPSL